MSNVDAELVCVLSGAKYCTPVTICVTTGQITLNDTASIDTPPEDAIQEKEFVLYDDEIFHIHFDEAGNYFIVPGDLDDFQSHVMG